MPACASCKKETPADQMMITGDGAICSECHDQRLLQRNEMRANVSIALNRREPENAFGDATFDAKKRQRAVWLFVATILLVIVLYGLKLARVM
jgi:hypothetical protein